MIKLTRFDGASLEIAAGSIDRVRQTTYNDGPTRKAANSRVDWSPRTDLFKELAADIAANVKKEVQTFIDLPQPGGEPVWFDGKKANGPVFVSKAQRLAHKVGKINSALNIAGKVQFTRATPQEVYDAIKAAGGTATPPYDESFIDEIVGELKEWFSPAEIWDAEMYSPLGGSGPRSEHKGKESDDNITPTGGG